MVALLVFGLFIVASAGVLAARWSLRLGPPHRLSQPQAFLGTNAAARLETAVRSLNDPSVDSVMAAAMALTSELLRFGLGHATSMRFDERRSANCVEYANLFAFAFNKIARDHGIRGEAFVVRSFDARVFGLRLPFRAWRDHDWVAIKTGGGTRFVDPTFGDALLGADLKRNVVGHLP
jgi:hypothetical protein